MGPPGTAVMPSLFSYLKTSTNNSLIFFLTGGVPIMGVPIMPISGSFEAVEDRELPLPPEEEQPPPPPKRPETLHGMAKFFMDHFL